LAILWSAFLNESIEEYDVLAILWIAFCSFYFLNAVWPSLAVFIGRKYLVQTKALST
jgi:hypothetical protein